MIAALRLAQLCADAYTAPPTWQRTPDRLRTDVRACRFQEGGWTVVAFPGTDDIGDALLDARACPRLDPEMGFIHAGFLEAIQGLSVALLSGLGDSARGGRLVLTGHSLGGALALLAGALFTLHSGRPAQLVTFGAPRVGMGKLVRILRAVPMLREYRNGGDPVTQVPCWPYRHVRALIPIGRPALIDAEDHHIAAYISALGATSTLTRRRLV